MLDIFDTHAQIQKIRSVGVLTTFFSLFSHQVVGTSLEKQLDPEGPIASQGGSLPVLLRKHIATCDIPGMGLDPLSPLDPCMIHSLKCSPHLLQESRYKHLFRCIVDTVWIRSQLTWINIVFKVSKGAKIRN